MTPVPKNLSPKQALAWRRWLLTGKKAPAVAKLAKGGKGYTR